MMEYTFNTNSITIPEGTIMHEWERPIMKELAKWACTNGGHIIEFGFGMGISAQYIQQHSIKSHTICEINPKVISNLKKWAHNKPNVIILEGDWVNNVSKMKTYDGILFDTFMPGVDPEGTKWVYFLHKVLYQLVKEDTKFATWHWGNALPPYPEFKNTTVKTIKVNPPPNDYYNHKYFNVNQMTLKHTDDTTWQI